MEPLQLQSNIFKKDFLILEPPFWHLQYSFSVHRVCRTVSPEEVVTLVTNCISKEELVTNYRNDP